MFLDARRTEYLSLHRIIPLAYAPYLGAEAFRVYVLYVALAGSEGHADVSEGDICRFLGIDPETLEQAHDVLESYRLIQLHRESVGSPEFLCTLLPPPPLPEQESTDLASRALPVDAGAVLPKPAPPRRKRQGSRLTAAKLIAKFYRGIHRPRIDRDEREMAKSEIEDLRTRYTLEQIDFAIEWTLENQDLLVQPVESFAIIRETIDQALAAQEQSMVEQTQAKLESTIAEESFRKQQRLVEAFRKTLTPEQLEAIHQKALARIESDPSIVKDLVTESFIRITEDAIILEEYMGESFEPPPA